MFTRNLPLTICSSPHQDLSKASELVEEGGKKLPAMTVFSRSIECLKMHLHKLLADKHIDVKDGDVLWVLTVPAIWDDTAKGFMREAAKQVSNDTEYINVV